MDGELKGQKMSPQVNATMILAIVDTRRNAKTCPRTDNCKPNHARNNISNGSALAKRSEK